MDLLNELYQKSAAENERSLQFWNNYLKVLKSLDFTVFSGKLKVPVLVPIGSRIMFRGELKHTNEVTVALGADYFVKCSIQQADIIRQHRIKGVQEKIDSYSKEKEYLQNQRSFTNENLNNNEGQELIEYHTEEEDKAWREKHKVNVKEFMQSRKKEKDDLTVKNDATDEELWNRLEELELQEELENELDTMDNNSIYGHNHNVQNILVKEKEVDVTEKLEVSSDYNLKDKADKELRNKKEVLNDSKTLQSDLLQQVINKQNELGEKLHELKNRERNQSKTDYDIMARLEELEQLDELEDEMDRLDDLIDQDEDVTDTADSDDEVPAKSVQPSVQRHVSFVDEDESETLNLTIKHSDVDSNNTPYNPENGIQKPSDIYAAYSNLFKKETISILKKSKHKKEEEITEIVKMPKINIEKVSSVEESVLETNNVISLKDVVEKVGQEENKVQTDTKPMSLFKKKRMQNKT